MSEENVPRAPYSGAALGNPDYCGGYNKAWEEAAAELDRLRAEVKRLRDVQAEKEEMRQALWDLLNDCINFDGGKLTDIFQANASAVLSKYAPPPDPPETEG